MHAHFKEGRLPTESEHNVIRNKNKKQSSLGWASLWGKSVGVFPPHLPPPLTPSGLDVLLTGHPEGVHGTAGAV